MIRVFDAFAGIGGFRSALEQVGGFKVVGWCEIDKYAQQAYRALYDTGGEHFYENIRDIDTGGLVDFDLLVGGFPCQPFSYAGRRMGSADVRGDLFYELARLLAAKRPRYFLFENVPGLLGIEKGETFKNIIQRLSELGYSIEWRVLDSAAVVPQTRKRVYLVGCLGADCTGKILSFRSDDAEDGSTAHTTIRTGLIPLIRGSQGQRVYLADGNAVTQCSGSGGLGCRTGLYFIDLNAQPQITDTARCLNTRSDRGVTGTHRGERSGVLEEGPRPIINPFKAHTWQNGRRVKEPNEPMFTLTVCDRLGIVHEGRIRRLMPVECWRLQGFTTEQFNRAVATGLSDAQLYKQAGNAVTVGMVGMIAENLLAFDKMTFRG